MQHIPVIDLFAGPGGLSHGFSVFSSDRLDFQVRLSIEKDIVAHRTLRLRAFLRQFPKPPSEYYFYIRGERSVTLDRLRSLYPDQWAKAEAESKQWTLGAEPFSTVSRSIREALDGAPHWLLLGGPPCQAYSLAGRSRMKNEAGFSTDEKHTLYREYLKIVAVHQPTVFVMENVKGILSSKHGKRDKETSIFHRILDDLRDPAAAVSGESDVKAFIPQRRFQYRIYSFVVSVDSPELIEPKDFVIRSEDWGIPQKRHRVILFGVRGDVAGKPKVLGDFFKRNEVNVGEVLRGLPVLRSRISKEKDSPEVWRDAIRELARGGVVSAIGDSKIRAAIRAGASKLKAHKNVGGRFQEGRFKPAKLSQWLYDPALKGVIQHESRSHMRLDLQRYFFAACAGKLNKRSPKLSEFPAFLLPRHKNAMPKDARQEGKRKIDFDDRFRVQLSVRPSTTITSHISKDGHYYIHYDPKQCRSLTVREAARLQTFPDEYFIEGNRTQQYHQVGNAVPPLLANRIAAVVADLLSREIQSEKLKRRKTD